MTIAKTAKELCADFGDDEHEKVTRSPPAPYNGRKSKLKIPPKKLVGIVDDQELLHNINQLENSLLEKEVITEKSVQSSAVHFENHGKNDNNKESNNKTRHSSVVIVNNHGHKNPCEQAGDGICDDDANNADCDWDGGDCCGSNVSKISCEKCKCLDPNQIIIPVQKFCHLISGFIHLIH